MLVLFVSSLETCDLLGQGEKDKVCIWDVTLVQITPGKSQGHEQQSDLTPFTRCNGQPTGCDSTQSLHSSGPAWPSSKAVHGAEQLRPVCKRGD